MEPAPSYAQNLGQMAEKWSQTCGHQLLPTGVLEGSPGRALEVCRGGTLVRPGWLPFGGRVEGAHGGLLRFPNDVRVSTAWISSFVNTFPFL